MAGVRVHEKQASAVLRRRPPAGDRGAGALELVLLTPLMFLLTFLPIQAALVLHARQIATAAAQEGARAARVVDLDAEQAQAAGTRRAGEFAALLGGNTLQHPSVTVNRDLEQVTVVVTGTALGVLPGFHLAVAGRSVSPVERFTAP